MMRRHPRHRMRSMDDPLEDTKIGRFCLKMVCKTPVCIVLAIVFGDIYVAFGYSRVILAENIGIALTSILLTLFGISVTILLISYFRCFLTSSAVKDNPPPASMDVSQIPRCEKCNELKPPRTHHCSICGTCTLKMDHHCPWVGNCVGLKNYKFFLIFLLWVSIAGTFYGIPTGLALWQGYDGFGASVGVWAVLSIFVTVSFAISVGGFFFFHVHLLSENRTTLENLRPQGRGGARQGRRPESPYNVKSGEENFADIFGDNKWLWFLPVLTERETGYEALWDRGDCEMGSEDGSEHGGARARGGDEAEQHRPLMATKVNVNVSEKQAKIMIESPTEMAMQQQMRHVASGAATGLGAGGGSSGGVTPGGAGGNGLSMGYAGGGGGGNVADGGSKGRVNVVVSDMSGQHGNTAKARTKGLRNMRVELVDDDAVFNKHGNKNGNNNNYNNGNGMSNSVLDGGNSESAGRSGDSKNGGLGKHLYSMVKGDSQSTSGRYRNMGN